ncbi:carboxylate--amine ligase [Halorussus halophilus]|uniref:carboxylate--amine ligase n=1 Tax=Halorussus halophilus TaxID=2650975 RepID=UPI0013013621|nr:ATP-grasp domain-containing protein [Halorussus halophilus]
MGGEDASSETVLIPTGYDPGSYPCIRSLSKRDVYTLVASENEDALEFDSRFCDERTVLPSPHDLQAYRDALLELATRSDVRTIIPVREEDIYLLSKYRERFEKHVSLAVPSLDALERVHDRKQLFDAAADAGVPIPETRLLSEVDDWDPELIIKSRYNLLAEDWVDGYDANAIEEVKTVEHVRPGEKPDVTALREEMKHDPIVQEFVPTSDEYMVAAIYDHGEPLATFQHRQIRGNSYTGGGSVYRESIYNEELEAVARTLLDHLDWHGLACIEYMKDERTGEFKLTEINPRMWQSLPFSVRAGADFPHYYWQLATGTPEEIDTGPEPGYEVGTGSHLLYGEFGYLLSVLRDESPHVPKPSLVGATIDLLWSCYEHPNFDYLRLDDPRPFVSGVKHMLSPRS